MSASRACVPRSRRRKSSRLSHPLRGQSVDMSSHEDRTVANPDRTHVDDDPTRRERDEDVHETRDRHDPHDQPWPAVAKEVKQAVEDADGPLG